MTTADDLRRLNDQSRARIAAARVMRGECLLIARESERRLAAGRRLLDRYRLAHRV